MSGPRSLVLAVLVAPVLCVAQCGGKAGSGSEASAGNPTPAKTEVLHLKTVQVMDREGAGIEVLRLLVPADWECESRVRWLLDVPSMPAVVWLRAYNPKGSEEFEVFPNQSFCWTDNEMVLSLFPAGSRYFGAEVRPPVSAQEALQELVLPRYRGDVDNLEVVSEEPMPALAELVRATQEPRPGLTTSADAAKARVTYSRGGKEFEEDVFAAVESYSYPLQTMYGWRTNTQWMVDFGFSCKAEKGKLEGLAPTLMSVAQSLRVNPLWFSKYMQMIEYLAQQQIERIESVGQLSRMLSQTSNEISDIIQSTYERRQEVNDRIAQKFSDYVLGVDRYYDPAAGREVELPSGHKVAWSNGQGQYILTDQTGYNPNVGSTQNWQQLSTK